MSTKTEFTTEQLAALAAFESASESPDLRAFGHGRRLRAWLAVAAAYDDCQRLKLGDALTDREHARGAEGIDRRETYRKERA